MDIIKAYFTNISRTIKSDIVDNYKIVTSKDINYSDFFLISDNNRMRLNSQTLIKLLSLKNLERNVLKELVKDEDDILEKCIRNIVNVSTILCEDKIFFEFDPYNNFLLSKKSKKDDIWEIIDRTIHRQSIQNNTHDHDFSRHINPYGLEKVVFTGGGTKGIIYMGALLGLLATGQIFYLNHFAGTSIGALTAMVMACITCGASKYMQIRTMTLREILTCERDVVDKYRDAVQFIIDKFYVRDVDTFYNPPIYTFYGIWTMFDKIIKNNGIYDLEKSGFHVWYAMMCKKICNIMKNELDKLIIIKKKDGTFVDFSEESINYDFENEKFEGWDVVKFFTFKEYYEFTNKKIVLTGTQTNRVETVYYTHTNVLYANLSVIKASMASMSIPWIFKAPVINGSYVLDGGIFDNYPLTHCDKKIKDKITHYNNRIFGYLIDDKNTIIDAYEVIREMWIVYNGFIDIINIYYLSECKNYVKISEMFFEIRLELYKFLYFSNSHIDAFLNDTDEKIEKFNRKYLGNILDELLNMEHEFTFSLPKKGTDFVIKYLKILNSHHENFDSLFHIGKKTNLADVIELSIKHGEAYNILIADIKHDIKIIESIVAKDEIILKYEKLLEHLMSHILAYYELKGTFIKNNDLEYPCSFFSEIMKNLYKNLTKFEKITNEAVREINKNKNYINEYVQIALTMVSKVLTKGSGNNIDLGDLDLDRNKSSYQKAIDYFFHTDMTGILYKYMCIANDRICNDTFNRMRTIKLNTFETSVLHFGMNDELKARLIYEGYSKTIKYFVNILRIMELTEKSRSSDEYLESCELRFKNII